MDLQCLKFSDLAPWERCAVDPLLAELSEKFQVKSENVTKKHRGCLKKRHQPGATWILCRRWKDALRYLGYNSRNRIYISVFGHIQRSSLPTLFWNRFGTLPSNVSLLTHSQINFRFYKEFARLDESRISCLPLPFHPASGEKQKSDVPIVGTYSSLTSESNLNYFVTVSHYLANRMPQVKMRVYGSGILSPHLQKMIADLELGDRVEFIESSTLEDLAKLDVFLYLPLQNDHFLTLLAAAGAKLPVVCSDISGIDRLLNHGESGYVVPVNETQPMGEFIETLLKDPKKREDMGNRNYELLKENFSANRLAVDYSELFFSKAVIATRSRAA